jgi:uncharacterized protein (TIGR03032 family)
MSPHTSIPGHPERASTPGNQASGSGLAVETRDIQYAYSENLPIVLGQLNSSLLVSTYQTGNLIVLSAQKGKLGVTFHAFERPMGIAVGPGVLAVGTRTQVWFLRNAPDIAAKLEPRGHYDACFLTRSSHFTGNIQCHELAWVTSPLNPNERGMRGEAGGAELWIVNTLFSCLCTVHPAYSFAPRWRPPFVTAMAPDDRCHLNGLAVAVGKARYVTSLAETDIAQAWRSFKAGAGCVIDVSNNQTISRGLSMPHSPRMAADRLFVLQSGRGQLVTIDMVDGRWETIAELPGYTRGLAIHGTLAFVGLSKLRPSGLLSGVPIASQPERLKCGFAVVDLHTGQVIAHFELTSGIDELFDIQILPGIASPFLSGPLADREQANPLWTVPPSR